MTGTAPAMSVPTLVAKKLTHSKKQVSAETEEECQEEHQHTGQPRHLAGAAVRFLKINAEHVDKNGKDK